MRTRLGDILRQLPAYRKRLVPGGLSARPTKLSRPKNHHAENPSENHPVCRQPHELEGKRRRKIVNDAAMLNREGFGHGQSLLQGAGHRTGLGRGGI